jgi:di/tricarboxylate transporter
MNKEEEIKAIDIQLIAISFLVISGIISFLITYNQKLSLEKRKTIFNSKDSLKITKFNRILSLILALVFLGVNIKLYDISKDEGEDLKSYTLQIIASILVVISGIIALYVVTLSETETISDVENPIV